MKRIPLTSTLSQKGYTLIELVVVVTILATLSTISFMVYSNMSSEARNSVRKADMSEMKVRLRGMAQKSGAFPLPSTPVAVTNSGFLALNMGWSDTVGTSNGSTLNTDPRSKRSYRYSTVANRQEYQIGMTLELDSETYSSYIDGYYTALSPYVFPSLLLATDTTSAIEIQQGNGSGTVNRTRFIVNNGSLNIPYDMNGRAVSKATTFSGILADPGVRLPWTSTFASCKEIYEGGKSMGPGGYLVISSTGALTMTGCIMSPPNY